MKANTYFSAREKKFMFKRWMAMYQKYKDYVRVDLVMYVVMILMIIVYIIYSIVFP
ncbi:MAG: hypothetical protein IM606_15185 [Cytophagales bacterium]|nr:hypothetical protein [Cytophagales bacterium]MCA6396525.1 hypothetical protein [Cytophagales bacterium]MCA6417241.1 hypothetical protein [Cytophagales bacterium]MCA6420583.1 hypothetical protein [Cytophagales bacterium]MCA6424577.1 hypothetical protein [Cytophagales bacterium]